MGQGTLVDIHLVFQGGGARLVTLLAAVEAVAEWKQDNFNFVGITGTSAGAIAAAVLSRYKTVDAISAARHRMEASARANLHHFDLRRTKFGIIYNAYMGKPLASEDALMRILKSTFEIDDVSSLKMHHIPDLEIIASNVCTGEVVRYGPQTPQQNVLEALCDSCAIPIVLRSYRNGRITDGGIVANLDTVVEQYSNKRVVAFSFPFKSRAVPSGIDKFCLSLLSAAMDVSVRMTRDKIISSGGSVIELPSNFDTFEFRDAINTGLQASNFNHIKTSTLDKLRAVSRNWKYNSRFNIESAMIENYNAFQRIQNAHPYDVYKAATIVTCNSLFPAHDLRNGLHDEVEQRVTFRPRDSILCVRIGISASDAFDPHGPADFQLTDDQGNEVKALRLNGLDIEYDGTKSYFSILYLDEPFDRDRGNLHARYRSHQANVMEKLKFNKIEYMRSINTGEMPVRYEDFILGIPASFGNVSMLDLIDNIEKLDEKTSHNFLSRAKKDGYTKGQKMSEIVLRDYFVGLPPPDIGYIGWRTADLLPGHTTGVLLRRSD